MRSVHFVNPMLDRDFLERWRHGLIVQTAPTNPEQASLNAHGQGSEALLNQQPALSVT